MSDDGPPRSDAPQEVNPPSAWLEIWRDLKRWVILLGKLALVAGFVWWFWNTFGFWALPSLPFGVLMFALTYMGYHVAMKRFIGLEMVDNGLDEDGKRIPPSIFVDPVSIPDEMAKLFKPAGGSAIEAVTRGGYIQLVRWIDLEKHSYMGAMPKGFDAWDWIAGGSAALETLQTKLLDTTEELIDLKVTYRHNVLIEVGRIMDWLEQKTAPGRFIPWKKVTQKRTRAFKVDKEPKEVYQDGTEPQLQGSPEGPEEDGSKTSSPAGT